MKSKHQKVAAHLKNLAQEKETTEVVEPKAKAKAKGNRMGEEELIELYPHVVPGTIAFLPEENKQVVTIECIEAECDNKRQVRTSDLFQVKRCRPCTLKARRANGKAKRAAKKAAEASEEAN